MKHQRTKQCGLKQQASSNGFTRGGVTLVEVLMSLLVMGVGVTAVATLFPMSVLRAVQGTQLTNSALLRYNAEAAMDMNRNLILDPDNDGDRKEHYSQTYVVDPLGYFIVVGERDNYGSGGLGSLVRYSGAGTFAQTNTAAEEAATKLVTSPDSWTTKAIDIATSNTTTSVTLANIDVEEFKPGLGMPEVRIIMTNKTGDKNLSHVVSDIAGKTVSWVNEDTNNNKLIDAGEDTNNNGVLEVGLPAGFQVGEVRLEAKTKRYNWMLTVKNTRGVANVNVVVYFQRSTDPFSEHVFSKGNGADNILPAASSSFPEYIISFDTTNPENVPSILRRGFLFDVEHARWYRIQKVVDLSLSSKRITLDRQPPEGEVIQHAMFPHGVVDVYPISSKTP